MNTLENKLPHLPSLLSWYSRIIIYYRLCHDYQELRLPVFSLYHSTLTYRHPFATPGSKLPDHASSCRRTWSPLIKSQDIRQNRKSSSIGAKMRHSGLLIYWKGLIQPAAPRLPSFVLQTRKSTYRLIILLYCLCLPGRCCWTTHDRLSNWCYSRVCTTKATSTK